MQSIANSVFRYERLGDSGYTKSSSMGKLRYSPYLPIDSDLENFDEANVDQILSTRFKNLYLLGPYEKYILLRLLSRTKTVNVVVGAKGCGKTATAEFLTDYVKNNEKSSARPFKRPMVARIDGNDMVPPSLHSDSEKVAYINGKLAERLRSVLLDCWEELAVVLKDLAKEMSGSTPASHVERLLYAIQSDIGGKSLTFTAVRDSLFRVLDTQSSENQVVFLFSTLGTLFSRNPDRFVYLCIDNLDPLDVVVQLNLAHWITSVVNPSRLPLLLVMRIITYRRCKSGALSLGVIPHYGVTPLKEIDSRFRNLVTGRVKNRDFDDSFRSVKAAFLLRCSEILGYLNGHDENPGEFKDVMRAVCGMSVQRGLACVQRLFASDDYLKGLQNRLSESEIDDVLSRIENLKPQATSDQVVAAAEMIYEDFKRANKRIAVLETDWPQQPPKTYHYSHMLFERGKLRIDNYGPVIANLFNCGVEESFSTVRLRVMRLVGRASSRSGRPIKVKAIFQLLSKLGYNLDQVCDAINELHFHDRRLLWCTGHNEFDTIEEIRADWNEDIGLTGTGRYYLKYLVQNLDYLAMMLADNDVERKNVFGGDATTRLTFAARLVYEAILRELGWATDLLDGKASASPDEALAQADFILLPKVLFPTLVGVERRLSSHHRNLLDDGRISASQFLRDQVHELKTKHSNVEARISQLGWKLPPGAKPNWQRVIDMRQSRQVKRME
jgi:hypothetical protein